MTKRTYGRKVHTKINTQPAAYHSSEWEEDTTTTIAIVVCQRQQPVNRSHSKQFSRSVNKLRPGTTRLVKSDILGATEAVSAFNLVAAEGKVQN